MRTFENHCILVADDDQALAKVICQFLETKGLQTASAYDGRQALELFEDLHPAVAVVDVCMPGLGGMEILDSIRERDYSTPVIIITAHPDMDTAIKAIKNGAFDFFVKPVQFELLYKKILQALETTALVRENALLSELASLHEITGKLSNTHDLEQLLEVTLSCCLNVSDADSGSIQLLDRAEHELVIVNQQGIAPPKRRSSVADEAEWPISKYVFAGEKALLIADGKVPEPLRHVLDRKDIGSSICVPLKVDDRVIGLVSLNRSARRDSFARVHLNIIDVLAAQAGIAINNANLYTSINQKLGELSLISNYSEKLMGLVDSEHILRYMITTLQEHIGIDFVGFFALKKRAFALTYWAAGTLTEAGLDTLQRKIQQEYFARSGVRPARKRCTLRRMTGTLQAGAEIDVPLPYSLATELTDNNQCYGILFIAARAAFHDSQEKQSLLHSIVNQTCIALTNAKLYRDMKENYIRTIKALAIAVDAKDTYTHGHSENVMQIAEDISKELQMDPALIEVVRDGGLLHDIGKIGIPGSILNKPGALTYDEFHGVMKTHSTLGANIVKDVPFLRDLYELILYHHEHFDGSGYPEQLQGDQIPLGARVLHVADAFEAMTSNRPYRASLGKQEAFRRLRKCRGSQFDPAVIDAFFKVARRKGWLNGN
ncbi:MAG: response regulator [Chitinivibrionales bacterium]|nr:response regulator [Chitinivibrionales bacterium]